MVSLTRAFYRVTAFCVTVATSSPTDMSDNICNQRPNFFEVKTPKIVSETPDCNVDVVNKEEPFEVVGNTKQKKHRFTRFRPCKRLVAKVKRAKEKTKQFCRSLKNSPSNSSHFHGAPAHDNLPLGVNISSLIFLNELLNEYPECSSASLEEQQQLNDYQASSDGASPTEYLPFEERYSPSSTETSYTSDISTSPNKIKQSDESLNLHLQRCLGMWSPPVLKRFLRLYSQLPAALLKEITNSNSRHTKEPKPSFTKNETDGFTNESNANTGKCGMADAHNSFDCSSTGELSNTNLIEDEQAVCSEDERKRFRIEDGQVSCPEDAAVKKEKENGEEELIVEVENTEDAVEESEEEEPVKTVLEEELDFVVAARDQFPLLTEFQRWSNIQSIEVSLVKQPKVSFSRTTKSRSFKQDVASKVNSRSEESVKKAQKSCLKAGSTLAYESAEEAIEKPLCVVDGDREFGSLAKIMEQAGLFSVRNEAELELCLRKFMKTLKKVLHRLGRGVKDVQLQSLAELFLGYHQAAELLDQSLKVGFVLAANYQRLSKEYQSLKCFKGIEATDLARRIQVQLGGVDTWIDEILQAFGKADDVSQDAQEALDKYVGRTSKCGEKLEKVLDQYLSFYHQVLVPMLSEYSEEQIHHMCGFDAEFFDIMELGDVEALTIKSLLYLQQAQQVLKTFSCTLDENLASLYEQLIQNMA